MVTESSFVFIFQLEILLEIAYYDNGTWNLFLNEAFGYQCVKISMSYVPSALHIFCNSGDLKQVSNNDMPWHKIPFEVILNWAENKL